MSEVVRRILEAYGAEEIARARELIGSRTLRDAIRLLVDETGEAVLHIPHYWAVFYHDGRGPIVPVSARKLVFFHRPQDDPRLRGGFPVRLSDVKRLTKAQYVEGLRRNRENAERGLPPHMYVLDRVGPAEGDPFFDLLTVGAAARMNETAAREIDDYLSELIGDDPDLAPETDTAYLNP